MKQLLSVLLLGPLALFAACVKTDISQVKNAEPEYIALKLGVSGDGIATKSETNGNLYGINVFYDSKKDGNINEHYAYGLFDNKEDMTIQLLSGYKYRFSCTMVKNGKTRLYYGPFKSNSYPGYAKPFQTNNSASTKLSNSFVYGTTYLSGIESGVATLLSPSSSSGYSESNIPSLERYYGSISNYSPVVGGTVTIPLKKTVFGVRFIINSVPEGSLSGSCIVSPKKTTYWNGSTLSLWSGSTNSTDYDSGAMVYSYPDVYECWQSEPQLSSTVNWNFVSSLFSQWNESGSQSLFFKRNVLTTVTISCTPDNVSGIISLQEEEIGEDNDIHMYLNSDGIIVIGIEPEPED